jgi:hypothetical protein
METTQSIMPNGILFSRPAIAELPHVKGTTMSVTSEFEASPQKWIITHRFVTPTASYVGAPGALATGNGIF